MEYQQYVLLVQQVSQLVQAEQYEQARVLLLSLVNSDISDRDKAMMCLNLAVVSGKLGVVEDALRWYDEGMAYEQGHGQTFVAECKAAYLAQHGKIAESAEVYKLLLDRTSIDEATRERIRQAMHAASSVGAISAAGGKPSAQGKGALLFIGVLSCALVSFPFVAMCESSDRGASCSPDNTRQLQVDMRQTSATMIPDLRTCRSE